MLRFGIKLIDSLIRSQPFNTASKYYTGGGDQERKEIKNHIFFGLSDYIMSRIVLLNFGLYSQSLSQKAETLQYTCLIHKGIRIDNIVYTACVIGTGVEHIKQMSLVGALRQTAERVPNVTLHARHLHIPTRPNAIVLG